MGSWFFQKHDGYGDIDQSSSAEAFSGSSIRDLSTALVREGIQNVIDARGGHGEGGPARVRITLRSCAGDPRAIYEQWFGKLTNHLHRPDAGAPDAPAPGEPCTYVAFEDFGTKGLVGDYTAPYKPGEENNFVNFLYHDGVTGKSESKLGSRGVGKVVFTMASRARTIFAFTVRENDPNRRPLLVGKNLLRFREVDGELFAGRSYFLDAWPEGQARQPVVDSATLAKFAQDFPIARTNQPGLSIVIPFIDASVTGDQLRRAIVDEYHYAILSGQLEVELNNNGATEKFTASNVPKLDDAEINAQVDLARWAVSQGGGKLQILAPQPGQVQRLTDSLVTDEIRNTVAESLNQNTRVAVGLQVYIHPKHSDPVLTHFDVYFEFAERRYAKPAFVRELLPVSDVREARPVPQIRALVVVRQGPLADLLRAAEGANHTDWSPRTDKFQEAYAQRRGEIAFVAQSVGRLIEIVRGQANEPVGGIATQFFSAAMPNANVKTPNKREVKPGPEPTPLPPMPEPIAHASYVLAQTQDGFTLRHNPGQPLAERLTIRVAYDVLRGSPWSDYDVADFDFRKTKGEVHVVSAEADVARKEPGNRLVIVPRSETFEVAATGFDPNRDLIVDVRDTTKADRKRKEKQDANSTDQLHQPQEVNA